ncbi:MAG: NAD(+)/NADH kinase [Planctomycetota bacterium]
MAASRGRTPAPGLPLAGARGKRRRDLSVLVLGDERKGGVAGVVQRFCGWLEQRVARVECVLRRGGSVRSRDADLVVVFGGDGSMLAAARRMGTHQRPTLGVNLGRLGFLTACGVEDAERTLEMALAGDLHEEPRLMISCNVERRNGQVTRSVLGINDGVLARGAGCGIVTLRAERGGHELATYAGDGLIVATPIGSTAYGMAAGGPVVAPGIDAFILVPLAPHTLTVRPLVMPPCDLDLVVVEAAGDGVCDFTVDGQVHTQVRVGDRVCLRPSPVRFRHLTRGRESYFDVLREKFRWAHLPRGGD